MPPAQNLQCKTSLEQINKCIITSSSRAEQQLQTYTDHYGGKWVGKKIDFATIPIYTYESLGSVGHIIISKPAQLSTDTTPTEFTTVEHGHNYIRRGVSWRCTVDGMGYEFLRHG